MYWYVKCRYAECRYAECRWASRFMLKQSYTQWTNFDGPKQIFKKTFFSKKQKQNE
jgi:hypothetical protein